MSFVEVVVNVPLRRSYGRAAPEPPPGPESGQEDDESLRTFHYHLPPELEDGVAPGHLVWVPFGARELQGVVVARAATAPVSTRPVLRLARSEPVLTDQQIELARWIGHTYVAPFSAAVKLFLPPGLLQRTADAPGVRARRELRVELLLPAALAKARLAELGRPSAAATALAWLLQAGPLADVEALRAICGTRVKAALTALAEQGAVRVSSALVELLVDAAQGELLLLRLRHLERLAGIVDALAAHDGPIWKSDLARLANVDLDALRKLAAAGIVALREEVRFRDPLAGVALPYTPAPALSAEQTAAWNQVLTLGFGMPAPQPFLLHGVTGSGKTEIYLRAIAEVLQRGRQALVLVPEISLTPQTVARFAGRFPGRVTVIHSELSSGERYDVWRAVRDGRFDVVVGPRSALFAPLPRLGLIVIDEEHEPTYKQDAEEWGGSQVFYDARAVAQRLAAQSDSVLLLGSATPSLESYFAAAGGRYHLLTLPQRVMGHRADASDGPIVHAELPPVEVVDMRQELRAGQRSIFSRSLTSALLATLDAGEQAILFLNRRGTNTFILCRDCGHVESCRSCEVPLTYHEGARQLVCHHCNRRYPVPTVCPECQSKRIKFFGAGTERIAEAVLELAPHARVLRWDADTTGAKGSHGEILRRFVAHEADVLIGTQMIAKGLDLPLVTLVGVVAADVGLFLPDFRSGERVFQLLTQVAGRAGRSERGGRVVVQTYRPEHYAIQAAARHDYEAFYRRELQFRQEHGYPPVRRLAKLVYWDKTEDKARRASQQMARLLRQRLATLGLAAPGAEVLGPTPAFFARRRGYYRWQIILCAPDPAALLRGLDIPLGWRVDVDPLSLL
jgi:primosomal protein N' (replication factor Y)